MCCPESPLSNPIIRLPTYAGMHPASPNSESNRARDGIQWYDTSLTIPYPLAEKIHISRFPVPNNTTDKEFISKYAKALGIAFDMQGRDWHSQINPIQDVLVYGVGSGLDAGYLYGVWGRHNQTFHMTGTQASNEEWDMLDRRFPEFAAQFHREVGGLECMERLYKEGSTFDIISAMRGVSGIWTGTASDGNRYTLNDALYYFHKLSKPGTILIMDVFTEGMEQVMRRLHGLLDERLPFEFYSFTQGNKGDKTITGLTVYELLNAHNFFVFDALPYCHGRAMREYINQTVPEYEDMDEIVTHYIITAVKSPRRLPKLPD